MKQYQSIARTYRPQRFSEVVGQEPIVQTLKNALKHQKSAHAYLFSGTKGTGKTTLARIFAKALNCQNLQEGCEPCNQCISCREITQGHSLDVIEIDGASNRGIDDMRHLNETSVYAPSSGKWKVYIIDEVHMLTKEAFNALLKTLEEPPEKVKFFFATTEPHKVLPTILSRCQRYDLKRIPLKKIVQQLSYILKDLGRDYQEEALDLLAHYAEGSLRDAQSLLDQIICFEEGTINAEMIHHSLGIVHRDAFFEFDRAIAENDLSFAFSFAQDIYDSGKDYGHLLSDLVDHFRIYLASIMNLPLPPLSYELQQRYEANASFYSKGQCLFIIDLLLNSMKELHQNPLKKVHLEMLLLKILRSKLRIPLEQVVTTLKKFSENPPQKTQQKEQEILQDSKISEEFKEVRQKNPEKELEQTSPEKEDKNTLLKPVPFSLASDQPQAPPKEGTITEVEEQKPSLSAKQRARYDTLMRFAAVELEGFLQK